MPSPRYTSAERTPFADRTEAVARATWRAPFMTAGDRWRKAALIRAATALAAENIEIGRTSVGISERSEARCPTCQQAAPARALTLTLTAYSSDDGRLELQCLYGGCRPGRIRAAIPNLAGSPW